MLSAGKEGHARGAWEGHPCSKVAHSLLEMDSSTLWKVDLAGDGTEYQDEEVSGHGGEGAIALSAAHSDMQRTGWDCQTGKKK